MPPWLHEEVILVFQTSKSYLHRCYMRAVYLILAAFLLLSVFFARWYLCTVRGMCELSTMLEVTAMIITGLVVGFSVSWLLSEHAFRALRGHLGGLQKEKTVLHEQLRLLERENQSARRHVAEWQQEGTLLSQVKKVTEPLLAEARHQVSILEQELKVNQRRYDSLKKESDDIRRTAEELRLELAEERAREAVLKSEIDQNHKDEATRPKHQKGHSRFTPSSWQTRDDLTKINGIGPKIQKKLNELGIYSYRQIAEFSPADVETVSSSLKVFKGRIGRDNWIGQAAALSIK
jgi:predicted flap endonuclease-1-like 5' DNA nuclease